MTVGLISLTGGNTLPFNSYVVFAGDSITAQGSTSVATSPRGFTSWGQILSNQRLHFDALSNAGIGGNTSAMLLARYTTDVTSKNPKVVTILIGTNELGAGSAAATCLSNISTMIAANRGIGARTILVKVLARGSVAVPMTSDQITAWEAINGGIATMSAADVAVIDTESVFGNGDPQHTVITGFTDSSLLHPSTPGARVIGNLVEAQINKWVNPGDILSQSNTDPLNLVPNGFMLGNSSGLATGWTDGTGGGQGGATYGFSKLARSDGFGEWQVITLSGTYTGTSKLLQVVRNNTDLSSVQIGDTVELVAEVQVIGAATALGAINLQFSTGGVSGVSPYSTDSLPFADPGDWAGVLRSPSVTFTLQGSATMQLRLFIWLPDTATTDPVSATIRIGRIGIRKV